ncbi:MAG: hypothetical protein K5778_07005 [Bacteroidaceae bacterium]|nr:hypothetical protein [Bacteroidaceae bacterium]
MRKIFVMAVFACFAAMNVNAQTEETESKNEKMLRLTKAADENPTDWKAQWEAGFFLLDKENEMYNHVQAEKYFERLFHLAINYNKEIPDSVIGMTGFTLMMLSTAPEKEDLDRALFYIDAMRHADQLGVDMSKGYAYMFDAFGAMYSMGEEEAERSLYYMTDLRNQLTKDKKPGIEHTDFFTFMLYNELMSKYKEMFSDKIMELTLDGKNYIPLSIDEWNIEKPFVGVADLINVTDRDHETLYYCCDDGTVTDDLHGQIIFSFYADKDGVKPQDDTNVRLITVTPERRKQLVEAYRKYMKKSKKNKK